MNARSAKLERLPERCPFPFLAPLVNSGLLIRAVALLHSFQYASAESAFGEIAQQDSRCHGVLGRGHGFVSRTI